MESSKLTLKLMVDTKTQKVLLAETDKKVVDFLFTLLSLPMGTIAKLLTKDGMVGSVGILYSSVETLSEAYMESNKTKISILEPKLPTSVAQVPLLLSNPTSTTPDERYYTCGGIVNGHNHNFVTTICWTPCPQCQYPMSKQMNFVDGTGTSKEKDRGYVKGLVTYMILDDLSGTPISTISIVTLFNRFNIKEVGSLEEMVVDLGMYEGLAILKASLQSKTVLTDVFLGKKPKLPTRVKCEQ